MLVLTKVFLSFRWSQLANSWWRGKLRRDGRILEPHIRHIIHLMMPRHVITHLQRITNHLLLRRLILTPRHAIIHLVNRRTTRHLLIRLRILLFHMWVRIIIFYPRLQTYDKANHFTSEMIKKNYKKIRHVKIFQPSQVLTPWKYT